MFKRKTDGDGLRLVVGLFSQPAPCQRCARAYAADNFRWAVELLQGGLKGFLLQYAVVLGQHHLNDTCRSIFTDRQQLLVSEHFFGGDCQCNAGLDGGSRCHAGQWRTAF